MTISANATFHENELKDTSNGRMQPIFSIEINNNNSSNKPNEEFIDSISEEDDGEEPRYDTLKEDNSQELKQRVLRDRNVIRQPVRYEAHIMELEEPKTYYDAMLRDDAPKWKEVVESELNALVKMNTWTDTKLPKERKPISARWVFTRKRNGQGNVIRYPNKLPF